MAHLLAVDEAEVQSLLDDMTLQELNDLQANLNGSPIDPGEKARRDREAAQQSYGTNPLFGRF